MSLWWEYIAPIIGTAAGIATAVIAVLAAISIAAEWWNDRHKAPAYLIRLDDYRRR